MCIEQKIIKKLLLTALLWGLSFYISFTQPVPSNFTGTIKGVIIDSLHQDVLSNVSVVLLAGANRQFIKGTTSKESGSFKFKGLAIKQYLLVFSCIGYRSKTIQLPPFTSAVMDLHDISLVSTAVELKEVQVVTQKQLIEQDADKLIYNVADDPDKQLLSAFDMLRKLPFLTVDANDNLQMNNSSNYQILLNGKRSSLFVNNPADVFKAMRASGIKTIEVITNPPSRYDAEGSGGIINIVTWKRSIVGYTGSATVAMESPYAFNVGSSVMAGTGRFGFSGQVAYNTQKNPANSQHFFREQKKLHNRLEQKGESKSNNLFRYTTGEVSYDLSARDVVVINYGLNNNSSVYDFRQVGTLSDSNRVMTSSYRRINNTNSKGNGYDAGLNYQHSFKGKEKQLFTVFYKISNNTNSSNSDFALLPVYNYSKLVSQTNNNDRQRERSFQMDYVHPVHQHTLELGLKSISLLSRSDYFYKHLDTAKKAFISDTALSNDFTYRQLVQAAYAAVNLKKNFWQIKIGARLERTTVNASFKSSAALVSRQYVNFIPNISLSRRLKGSDLMRLSYMQRLERPGFYFLNPYIDVTNPANISYGNPALHPAVSHIINYAYSLVVKRTFLSLGVAHTFTNNTIQQFTSLGTDTIARTTYGNIGRSRNSSVSLMINTTLFKKLTFSLNSINSYIKYTSSILSKQQINKGFSFSLFSAASFRFNSRWRINGDISYNSSNLSAQGRTGGFVKNSLSVNKQFLKDNKAGLSISVSNPFQKMRRSFTEIDDPLFYQLQETRSQVRRFAVSFNYRFGKVQ